MSAAGSFYIARFYCFKHLDPVRGWVKARYVAELEEIRDRYQVFEILGFAETRNVPDEGMRHFATPATGMQSR